ncbi:uridine kinase family protein [Jidongwangia harbinensis]|uniref:uridine kinase family protein n=1 Tax=Jidongwangia harbinensis TaxID=2878561 RepID=UPI001CDA14FA|nr:hypothetical protein [Jidongwangia harbinensis]MCA2213303.1 hypothetical protein [Jidongwangia harbinensis]
MRLGPGEPAAGPWRVERLDLVARTLVTAAGSPPSRPRVIAVDGRGGSGKSTLAARLQQRIAGAAVVHTDDVAWWHSRFGWDDLMIEGILRPLHAGQEVHYQPPAWAARGRTGHIDVPGTASTVIVEGVGASRREVAHLIDVAVWVQSDFAEAERRGVRRDVERDGLDVAVAEREWQEWAAEEVPFLLADQPWERADLVVAGTPPLPHDPETELVIMA